MAKRCQLPRMSPQKKKTENFNPPTRFTPKSCIKQRAENPPPLSDFNGMLSRHALFFPFFYSVVFPPTFSRVRAFDVVGRGRGQRFHFYLLFNNFTWIVRFENSPGSPQEARLCGEIRAKWESVFRLG